MSRKSVLTLAAAGALLAGCATGPYYDSYSYDDGYYYDRPVTRYYEPAPPAYYAPYYVGPSIGLGFTFGGHRHYRRR